MSRHKLDSPCTEEHPCELCRLRAINAELLEACKALLDVCPKAVTWGERKMCIRASRAIANAEVTP